MGRRPVIVLRQSDWSRRLRLSWKLSKRQEPPPLTPFKPGSSEWGGATATAESRAVAASATKSSQDNPAVARCCG